MAIYYVRTDGNDSNSGLGPAVNQAWRSIAKALGATGIGSGDTLYIAPGSYNESVTIGMVSATATTLVIGDPTASQFTGVVAGPVYWTVYNTLGAAPALTSIIATSKNFLSFHNIYFDGGTVQFTTSTNTSFTNCQFINGYNGAWIVDLTSPTSTALNATFTKCTFTGRDFLVRFTGQNVADNTSFVNCLAMGARLGFVGTNCQYTVYNCTFFGIRANPAISTTGGSATFKSNFVNNLFYNCQQAIYCDTSNVATQSYNRFIDLGQNLTNIASSVTSTTTYNSGLIFPYQLQNSLGTFQMFSSILGGPNTSAGTATGAPATDMYGVTWSGATPDTGSATYRNIGSGVTPYIPTERTNNSFTVSPNTTNRTELIYLGAKGLTHTTPSLLASYVRAGAIRTAITLVSQTPNGSWTSGGFCEIDSTNMPGIYRIDVPNALFVAGAESAMLQLTGASQTNGAVVHYNMAKVQFDLSQNVPLTNTAHSIGDALNAARAQGFGKWQIVGNTMNIYAEDGITLVKSFNLDSGSYPTQRM